MDSTAQRIAPPPAVEAAPAAPPIAQAPDDLYFMTSADVAPRIDDNVQLAVAPPWLGAMVVLFWLALVVGSALRRTLLRHSGPDFPHGEATHASASRPPVHARSGIRAHLRAAPVRALRRPRH